ncbi:MAG: type II 3-dehydroquinate dehydratase [Oscillospiraceae bacterium]|nr:type II 3-dehydroquinate dehydratase [Oscillospiraceae bacterium]
MKIYIINGPNLNLLGTREPEIYGKKNLSDINDEILQKCESLGCECEFFQSNHEGEMIDKLHEAGGKAIGVILNAGAFTHYSYAIRDAVSAIQIPVIELHISNIYAREEFRHKSVISEVCRGAICGFGTEGYSLAAEYLIKSSK